MTGSRPAGTTGSAAVVLAVVGGLFAVVVLSATTAAYAVALAAVGAPAQAGGTAGAGSAPSPLALDTIPAPMLALYRQAAPTCPGLAWSVLAAIGSVETDHGRSRLPGVASGQNSAGAAGPMQFLAGTFAQVVAAHPPPPGGAHPPSRYNPHDAVHAAASYLCDNGAPANLRAAIFAYNHAGWYVDKVLRQADAYRTDTRAATGTRDGPPETATVADPSGTGGRITTRLNTLYNAIAATGGLPKGTACWSRRPQNPGSDHPRGTACDLSYTASDPADVARGWQMARWLTTVQKIYGIRYLIWQGQIWTAESPTWAPYRSAIYRCPDPRNVTGCHYDHIHVSVY